VVFVGLKKYILAFRPDQWSRFLSEATTRHSENSLLVSKMRSGPLKEG
jgi:hypothetical protein